MTDQNDTPAKTPVETAVDHAVEALVYAPIGLLFEGASILPQLVEKGRNQVTMARMLGQFAVQQGRQEATKAASKLQDQAAGVLEFIGGSVAPIHGAPSDHETPAAPRPAAAPRPLKKAPGTARAAARKVAGASTAAEAGSSAAAPKVTAAKAPAKTPAKAKAKAASSTVPTTSNGSSGVSGLAIPDYDGLSASHVVNRLEGLSAAELEAVRAYEAAHRGRKTILSKVAQLQSA